MLPQTHFLFALLVAMVFNKLGHLSVKLVIITAILAVLIDLDHLVEYFVHRKKISLKNTWNNAVRFHKFEERSFVHHIQGFVIVTGTVAFLAFLYWKVALVMAIAYYTHMLLDYVHMKKDKFLRFKFANLYFKEAYQEIALDAVLLLSILLVLVL